MSADMLEQFDQEFDQAKEPENSAPPDGRYSIVIEGLQLTKAKSSGNPMLKWTLGITTPGFTNRKLFRNNVIKPGSREQLGWLKADLKVAGLELGVTPGFEKLSDLPNVLEQIIGVHLEVQVKSRPAENGDVNTNVYLKKRLEGPPPEAAAEGAEGEPAPTDDIPF